MRQRRNSIEPKWKRSSTPRTITLPICVWMAPVKLCTLCAALLHCLLQVWPVAAVLVRPAAGYCAGPATEGRKRLSSCTDKRKPDAPYHKGTPVLGRCDGLGLGLLRHKGFNDISNWRKNKTPTRRNLLSEDAFWDSLFLAAIHPLVLL